MLLTRHIGAAEADILIEAAAAEAEAIGVPQNIAVVDGAGHLVAFRRMDGAKFMAIEIAINKAFTAAGARRPTAALWEAAQPGAPGFGVNTQHQGRVTILAGGLPLALPDSGDVVGAIGVSSGSTAQDAAVAEAGLTAFLEHIAGTAKQ
ncbi:MAG: heme-binding protein [Hyphomicrobiales bacterium]|nr:MAG: heme-binding protein [Hyphomicrobiales bacterium]